MIKPKLRHLPLAVAAMVACMSAHADYQSPDGAFRLSGFGTIGFVKNGTDDAEFNYLGQSGGAGKKGSFTPDSKVAVQGTYAFAPTFSVTSQIMSKYDALGSYAPEIEWAFAKWQAAPSLMLRAGKMGAPYFMISDFRDVGYSSLTARPPLDVYGLVPVSQLEGADAAYQLNIGDTTLTSTLWMGDSKAQFASAKTIPGVFSSVSPVNVDIKHQIGLNVLADLGNGLSLRAGRVVGKMSLSSELGTYISQSSAAAQAGLGQYALLAAAHGDTASAAAAAGAAASLNNMDALVDPTSVFASFSGLGLAYDEGNWVGSLEYTQRRTDSFVTNANAWYGNIGYRINKFTPFIGLSKVIVKKVSNPVSGTNLSSGGLALADPGACPAHAGGCAAALDYATGGIAQLIDGVMTTQDLAEKTMTLGLRWDATSNTAVKFQWDRINKPADSRGMFFIADPTKPSATSFLAEKRNVNVLTVSVDFLF